MVGYIGQHERTHLDDGVIPHTDTPQDERVGEYPHAISQKRLPWEGVRAVSESHPLVEDEILTCDDLAPDDYPRAVDEVQPWTNGCSRVHVSSGGA